MYHNNYWFWIESKKTATEWTERTFVLRLLKPPQQWETESEPIERLLREAETLKVLSETDFPWAVPEFVCFVRDGGSEPVGMIETAVAGIAMDSGQFKDERTLRLIGRIAADVHRLPADRFGHLPMKGDRRSHVTGWLGELPEGLFQTFPLAADARVWIESHLPPTDHAYVLHSDLLPQNLVYDWEQSQRDDMAAGVVDWEMAKQGDPAYDLAIVRRGGKKVLGVSSGLRVLVEAYREAGGAAIAESDVRVHEVLLVLNWLSEAWRESQQSEQRGHGPAHYEQQLRSLLRRAGGAK